jgi:hypothetical protein
MTRHANGFLSGPGRDNKDVLSRARLMGVVIYPGVPNTSEGTQEMDKLFAYSKGLMERNRQTISVERKKGGSGVVTVYDLALILFGGELEIGNGTPSVELPNAFELGFDAAHLKRAREACGYCPFTRNALHDPKCRRVLGDLDLAQSPGRPMNNVIIRIRPFMSVGKVALVRRSRGKFSRRIWLRFMNCKGKGLINLNMRKVEKKWKKKWNQMIMMMIVVAKMVLLNVLGVKKRRQVATNHFRKHTIK